MKIPTSPKHGKARNLTSWCEKIFVAIHSEGVKRQFCSSIWLFFKSIVFLPTEGRCDDRCLVWSDERCGICRDMYYYSRGNDKRERERERDTYNERHVLVYVTTGKLTRFLRIKEQPLRNAEVVMGFIPVERM